MPQDDDAEDPRAVERRRVEYLRRHREQIQLRYRLEAERCADEMAADGAAMRARRDDVRAAKKVGENKPKSASLPGIYARFDELEEEELQLLAKRLNAAGQTQLNARGKYHARYMRDAYPIAGSQLGLEKEREMEVAAKKKLLLTDASLLVERKKNGSKEKTGGVLSLGLDRAHGRLKLDQYVGKLTTTLKSEQVQMRRTEAERQIRLCDVQHRQGLEQFWRLMHAAPKREVIAWLKFHSFLDVNIPVRIAAQDTADSAAVIDDRTLGITPLMAACRSLCVDLVRCLLEHGAVVWLATANGDTALHFLWRDWTLGATDTIKDVAVLMLRSQHIHDILEVLIPHGLDVNAQNALGETALQFCARYGLLECAKLLLLHGADSFIRDRKGKSAVQYAEDGHYEGLHQLLLHYKTIERVRAREKEWHETTDLLKLKRGALTATWSQTPEHFFTKLKVEQARAGHLRNQYVDSRGHVIVCPDEEEEVATRR